MTRSGKLSLRGRHPKGGKGERQREDRTREDRGTFSLCSRVHFDFPPFLRPATQAEVNYTPLVFYRSAAEFKGKCKTVKLFAKHMKVTLINRLWIQKKLYPRVHVHRDKKLHFKRAGGLGRQEGGN